MSLAKYLEQTSADADRKTFEIIFSYPKPKSRITLGTLFSSTLYSIEI